MLQLHRGAILAVAVIVGLMIRTVEAADPFPTEALPAQWIGGSLPSGFETSGVVWHTRLDRLLLVSDGGTVASMNGDGTGVNSWSLSGDLEGICIANPSSDFVYIGVENPDSIIEFNITTGLATRTFDLTSWMTGAANSGLEALTFVPDAGNPEGGLFYAGLQETGAIYKFELPIQSSSTSTTVSYEGIIAAAYSDISGMNYDVNQHVLYSIYDTANRLRATTADGALLKEWVLPGNDQEGVALHDSVLYIAEDYGSGGNVAAYSPFAGVPEPTTATLLGTAALGWLAYRARRRTTVTQSGRTTRCVNTTLL